MRKIFGSYKKSRQENEFDSSLLTGAPTANRRQRGFLKLSYKILSLIGVGIILYFFTKSTNKFEKELLENGKFAIGTFSGYSYSPGTRGGNKSFQYFFYDSEEKYHNGGATLRGKYPNKNQRKILLKEDKFLILYNLDGSLILFDYPIKDSVDFKRYIKEFEQVRKQRFLE